MKVLLISNAFPNSAEPVRGIFTYQIVKALQKKCDIEVVAPLPWVPPFLRKKFLSQYPHANVPAKEKIGDIQVHHPRYLVIPKILGFMHAVLMYFTLFKLVNSLENKGTIDLINAHWIFPDGVAATWVGKILKKPVVLTALGCDINQYLSMILRRIQISKALKASNEITAKSSDLKNRIVSLGVLPQKVKVIPNGVDLDLFRIMDKGEARRRLGIQEDRPIILTVGSQDQVKGTKYLIEAFHMISEKMKSSLQLVCIGDGPLRPILVSQVHGLGIADDVLFLGRKPHNEIPLWMNAADLFCLPSLREGHPNVVMESLACGIPIVASNVGSVPELINDSNGKICIAGDSVGLSQMLFEALNIRWDRVSIRDNVKGDWEQCGHEYYKTYYAVLNRCQLHEPFGQRL
jgi:teichuronic acid biosynthesis glycosyltransferase TuaC